MILVVRDIGDEASKAVMYGDSGPGSWLLGAIRTLYAHFVPPEDMELFSDRDPRSPKLWEMRPEVIAEGWGRDVLFVSCDAGAPTR